MRAHAMQFLLIVAAGVVAQLAATSLINKVRTVRNFTGGI